MSRVFVLSPSRLDVSSAETFGEIVYLYYPPERVPSVFAAEFSEKVWERMKELNFDADKDYILVMGSMVAMTQWVAAIISEVQFCKALLFNVVENRYISRIIGFQFDPSTRS